MLLGFVIPLRNPYGIVELYESLARSPWLTVYRALQVIIARDPTVRFR